MRKSVWVLLVLFIYGCSDAPPESTNPIPTQTPIKAVQTATPTIIPPTATAVPPTATPIPPTATHTPAPTEMPRSEVRFKVFHDFNGNGEWDSDEPPLQKINVQAIVSSISQHTCESDQDGYCIVTLPIESDFIVVEILVNDPSGELSHILLSKSEYKRIDEEISLVIKADSEHLIPLGYGLFTEPISGEVNKNTMYDHSRGKKILRWDGEYECSQREMIPGLCDAVPPFINEYYGIGYEVEIGTPIHAAAPGKVYDTLSWVYVNNRNTIKTCMSITIAHPGALEGESIFTTYENLSETHVVEGNNVDRGEVIGLSGEGCLLPWSTFSFQLRTSTKDYDSSGVLDFYKPQVHVPTGFWLYLLPNPEWITERHPGNYRNWWTAFNDPKQP